MNDVLGGQFMKKPLVKRLLENYAWYKYEINDKQTRDALAATSVAIVRAEGFHFLDIEVMCDERNNPPSVIDNGDLVCTVSWIEKGIVRYVILENRHLLP